MKDELIKFETAKLAKEKGYPIGRKLVGTTYTQLGSIYKGGSMGAMCYEHYPAPTQSLLQKWLREEHGIHAFSHPIDDLKDWMAIVDADCPSAFTRLYSDEGGSSTYEQALEKALYESLKLIKT